MPHGKRRTGRRVALRGDRPSTGARRPRPSASFPAAARRGRVARRCPAGRGRCPPVSGDARRHPSSRAEGARTRGAEGDRRDPSGPAGPAQASGRRGDGRRGRSGRGRRGAARRASGDSERRHRRRPARRRGRFRHPGARRHAAVHRESEGPHRDRRGPEGDRHRARRQGQRRPLLLPHRHRRRARIRAGEPRNGAGPHSRIHTRHRPRARQARGDGGHRFPGSALVRGLQAGRRGSLPGRHERSGAGGVPLR